MIRFGFGGSMVFDDDDEGKEVEVAILYIKLSWDELYKDIYVRLKFCNVGYINPNYVKWSNMYTSQSIVWYV